MRFCLALISLLLFGDSCSTLAGELANVLLIVSDDQRPDTIAALGNSRISTPNLDELVRRGTTFTKATCGFPLCVPSRAEILTGQSGWENGVFDRGGRLKEDCVFWASKMRNAGYQTCYCGKWMNDGSPQTRGYQKVRGLFSAGDAGDAGRKDRYGRYGRLITGYRGWTFKKTDGTADLSKGIGLVPETSRYIADAAIELIEEKTQQPLFLHLNFTAPHDPLVIPRGYENKYAAEQLPAPKNFMKQHPFDHGNLYGRDEKLLPHPRTTDDVREEIAAYYAVIDDMDAQIGRVIDVLRRVGALKNTIVIFTSDHGLALGSHGLMGKQNMYEHTINVPMIVAGPGVMAERVSGAQVYLRDLYPTVCELLGIPLEREILAKSFAPVLRGSDDRCHDYVYGYFYDFQRMIRGERWKLIFYPQLSRFQMFDLKSDPDELVDLSEEPSLRETRDQLLQRMRDWFSQRGDRVFSKSNS